MTASLNSPVPKSVQQNLKRGYLNAVSFLDRKVGEILDGLDSLGVSDNTIIILHGDHGYHLGEHGLWAKETNFEMGTRVPLWIKGVGNGTLLSGTPCSFVKAAGYLPAS